MSQLSVRGADFPQPKVLEWGWKSRMDNVWAACLNVKFKYLPQMLERRKEIAEMYWNGLIDMPITLPIYQEGQVWQEYHVRLPGRDEFVSFMKKRGVELLVRDTIPNHLQPGLGLSHWNLPITEKLSKEIVRLPLYPELTNKEVAYIVDAVRAFYA